MGVVVFGGNKNNVSEGYLSAVNNSKGFPGLFEAFGII